MPEWTDESRAALVAAYLAKDPTGDTSTEILKEICGDFDATVNGARRILYNADVYVKKEVAASTTTSTAAKESKADSVARLNTVIESHGLVPDDTIISKLTGKAAAYLADTITKIIPVED